MYKLLLGFKYNTFLILQTLTATCVQQERGSKNKSSFHRRLHRRTRVHYSSVTISTSSRIYSGACPLPQSNRIIAALKPSLQQRLARDCATNWTMLRYCLFEGFLYENFDWISLILGNLLWSSKVWSTVFVFAISPQLIGHHDAVK